uniref:Gustatory receptor n=1 Tax=viral metagenome TaxID=1070528 RepID=A0A6C0ACN4_9ZZZZ
MLIEHLLKLNGYFDILDKPIQSEKEVVIENGLVEEIDININFKWYQSEPVRFIINIFYKFLTFGVHFILPIYSITKAINNKDVYIFTSNLINFVFLTQYIAGYRYFRKEHFKGIKQELDLKLCYLSLILSIIMSIMYCIMLGNNVELVLYSDILKNTNLLGKIFTYFLLFIEKLYGYNVLFNNLYIFIKVFTFIDKTIENFLKDFENILESGERLEISTIIAEFSMIKSDHKYAVESINCIFSDIIIVSFISGYFVAFKSDHNEIGVTQYINVILCALTLIYYFVIINRVKNNVEDIKSLVNTEKFYKMYKENVNMNDIGDFKIKTIKDVVKKVIGEDNSKEEEYIFRTAVTTSVNQYLSEWLIIDSKLSNEWETFTVFGFDVDDSSLLQKGLGLIVAFLMITNLPFLE